MNASALLPTRPVTRVPGDQDAPAKLVRADFSKARGALTMRQASLVRVEKGYAVSFTFIGGSEDEVNQLVEKLSFVVRKR